MQAIDKSRCECGGQIVHGYMYGNRFIEGDIDLEFAFRDKTCLLDEIFPDGVPERGEPVTMCSKCLKIIKK